MTHNELGYFQEDEKAPLLFSLLELAKDHGYSSRISFDFYDAYVEDEEGNKILGIKTVKNYVSQDLLERLVLDKLPRKIILVEGDSPHKEKFMEQAMFLSSAGCGLYIRGHGWVFYPSTASVPVQEDSRYILAPRWNRAADGRWLKRCTSCRQNRTPDEFYDNPNRTGLDPKRNQCIICFRMKHEARVRRTRGREDGPRPERPTGTPQNPPIPPDSGSGGVNQRRSS